MGAQGDRGSKPSVLRDAIDGEIRFLEQLLRRENPVLEEPLQRRAPRLLIAMTRERSRALPCMICHARNSQRLG